MIKYTDKCTGCTACENVCKFNAIKMQDDKDGFKYPHIDKKLCVDCKACEKVCPLNSKKEIKRFENRAYACFCNDNSLRLKSSSGGIFSVIAIKILEDNGVVYGAAFDEEYKVKHLRVNKIEDIEKLRGSKYVQSNLDEIFKDIEAELKSGQKVLFSGTQCQVAGLLSYLKNEYSNLYTLDFICHGVPSPKVWKKYLEFRKKIDNQDEILGINFREKSMLGWDKYEMHIKYSNKEYRNINSEDLYMKAFLGDVSLRKSCYECEFKGKERKSDITLADFWGVKKVMPSMYGKEGTSAVMTNSKKGQELFDGIKNSIEYKEVDINDVIKYNPSMVKSVVKPKNREKFFEKLDTEDFEKLVKNNVKAKNNTVVNKVKRVIKKVLMKCKVLEKD